ncbi:MAG: 30S ribosome-binding factor RbfA [Bacilli bacterium]|jgi:ribosome-binding factor A|nr:30S ribosome-binding factor RbfA [Bacilli bacterium]
MASSKVERLQHIILKNVSHIIQFEMKNKVGLAAITDVKVTNDLSYATIYVHFYGEGNHSLKGMEALEKAKGFIRSKLSKELSIRKVPELIFKIDNSLEQGNRIEEIIKKINEK